MGLFDRNAVKIWRRRVWKEIHRLGFHEGPEAAIGLVVIAVAGFGTSPAVLAEVTGCERAFVRDVLRRMRKARVLRAQTLSTRWDEKGFGGRLSLGLDIMAVVGEIRRVASPKRSTAQRKRKVATTKAARRPKAVVSEHAVFTPRVRKGDAWYESAGKSEA